MSALLFASTASVIFAQAPGTCGGMTVGQNSSLNGFIPFPATDPWRQDVTNALVDGNSDAIVATIGANVKMHPDFGAGLYDGSTMGIPYQVVSGTPTVKVTEKYGVPGESDAGPMPIPANSLVEGYPAPSGDRHVLVLDKDNCWLYELYSATKQADGSWDAYSAAVWDLQLDNKRPYNYTSADAAGLPVFPGLTRYDEVQKGAINHALRFTLPQSERAFVLPASHAASSSANPYFAPMGMRLRLRANFDISKFTPQAKIILTALKKYGMIMADNGSALYLSGAPNSGWNNTDLHNLGNVTAADFEVLEENPLYTPNTVPAGAAAVINSFAAVTTTVAKGTPVTLHWAGSNVSYYTLTPQIGAIRGNTVLVTPTATTTYTLTGTNQYGQTSESVTVKVH